MLVLIATVHALLLHAETCVADRLHRCRDDRGQSTAEYALVLVGAAGIALVLITWASRTNRVTQLLNAVLERILGHVRG